MTLGRVERLQIMLTEEELGAIDDWRFARRMPSRAAAIRELLKRGLTAEGFAVADRNVKSKEFGLMAKQKKFARRGEGAPPTTNAHRGSD
jgi:hypothetical protein